MQLKRLNEFSSIRRARAQQYDELFENHPRIKVINHNYREVVPHIYVIQIDQLKDRRQLQKSLLEKGIQTGVHYLPNHTLSYFEEKNLAQFPVTEKIYSELLTIPLHPNVSEDDVAFIASQVKSLI